MPAARAPSAVLAPADEPFVRRWSRRVRSLAAHAVAMGLLLALAPVVVPLAIVVDVGRRNRLGITRLIGMLAMYLACEQAGVWASAWVWLTTRTDRAAFLDRNFRLQCWWATTLYRAGERLFGLHTTVTGLDAFGAADARNPHPPAGPVLVLVRHTSVADTLLPAAFVSAPLGLRLRYVLKRELLWDPCLDIVGQRLPNVFVRRGSSDPAREIAAVQQLADGLGPRDGALIFPEGTRFSATQQARALEKLAASAPALAARARTLRHVLPPRLGGVLGLLDAAPDADVVFCAHVGFDGVRRMSDLWNGALVGREVRVHFWRCARAGIPADREARIAWLYTEWARLDAWVGANAARGETAPAGVAPAGP